MSKTTTQIINNLNLMKHETLKEQLIRQEKESKESLKGLSKALDSFVTSHKAKLEIISTMKWLDKFNKK